MSNNKHKRATFQARMEVPTHVSHLTVPPVGAVCALLPLAICAGVALSILMVGTIL